MSKVHFSKFFGLFLVFSLISFGFQSPFGFSVKAALTDYGVKPLANVSQPAKGQTYTDPTFGTKVLRLTDNNDGGIASVAYSYWPAFNCNSTKLFIALDWAPYLYNFDSTSLTFQKVGTLFNTPTQEMQWEGMTWSTSDPNTVYGISGYNSNVKLRAFDVTTKQYTFEHDFTAAGELPAGNPWQMSKSRSSDRYFSFHWRPADGQPIRYAVIYVIQFNATERSGGHGDYGSNKMVHIDIWGSNGNRTVVRSLSAPATWTQIFDSGVSDWNTDQHLSMTGPNDTWACISSRTTPADYSKPFTNEIFLAKTDGS